jgi:AcrR family transcriptional regulator
VSTRDPDAPRKRVPAAERRARILEVARSTFLQRGEGINGVSMRLIAERGGIDEALIYRAAALGVSRNEYLRRRLSEDARRSSSTVEVADLVRFDAVFGDLADPEVMDRAWDRT